MLYYYILKVIVLLLKDVSPQASQLPVGLPSSCDYTCWFLVVIRARSQGSGCAAAIKLIVHTVF
jgi:hypothetical protein